MAMRAISIFILVMFPVCGATTGLWAQGVTHRPKWWGPYDEQRWVFSGSMSNEPDSLKSGRAAVGYWDASPYDRRYHEPPMHLDAWLSYGQAADERVGRLGVTYG